MIRVKQDFTNELKELMREIEMRYCDNDLERLKNYTFNILVMLDDIQMEHDMDILGKLKENLMLNSDEMLHEIFMGDPDVFNEKSMFLKGINELIMECCTKKYESVLDFLKSYTFQFLCELDNAIDDNGEFCFHEVFCNQMKYVCVDGCFQDLKITEKLGCDTVVFEFNGITTFAEDIFSGSCNLENFLNKKTLVFAENTSLTKREFLDSENCLFVLTCIDTKGNHLAYKGLTKDEVLSVCLKIVAAGIVDEDKVCIFSEQDALEFSEYIYLKGYGYLYSCEMVGNLSCLSVEDYNSYNYNLLKQEIKTYLPNDVVMLAGCCSLCGEGVFPYQTCCNACASTYSADIDSLLRKGLYLRELKKNNGNKEEIIGLECEISEIKSYKQRYEELSNSNSKLFFISITPCEEIEHVFKRLSSKRFIRSIKIREEDFELCYSDRYADCFQHVMLVDGKYNVND